MDIRRLAARPLCVLALAGASLTAGAQPSDLGPAPVVLRDAPYVFDTAEQHGIRVTVIARGLPHPFSLEFLPNGDALISERGARLRLVRGATGTSPQLAAEPVSGMLEPPGFRNGGLHDLALHPRFAENRLVYFTFNERATPPAAASSGATAGRGGPGGRATWSALVVARGRLDANGTALTNVERVFVAEPVSGVSGSRVAFSSDGFIYVTTGAPFGDEAQDPSRSYGKVLRLTEDGKTPADNPFAGREGGNAAVYSIGHRDQLGLVVHPSGAVLSAEHGPNGGDEINLILPGRNYGWPLYSFGRAYEGPRATPQPTAEGIELPLVLFVPSIAPTSLEVYTGERFPAWRGNVFVGSARIGEIPRTGGLERIVLNDNLEELRRERMLTDLRQRIRDVRQGPDGLLYVITDEDDGALLRIEPAN